MSTQTRQLLYTVAAVLLVAAAIIAFISGTPWGGVFALAAAAFTGGLAWRAARRP
ncbi:hypothetical protein [Cellulomonas sp. IC4_254]|uniref:hypothetical protein n=1 Tax=Cellulomonas sp. IC4_254 TaxID=2714040 RepID=UPI001421FA61|nr:hypothetical protein [Cellulomonas sp. IC4_254]NHT16123.1 hypothetical protein [Cellulomonas sp. IC4_254]